MISRKVLYSIVLGVAVVLIVTWRVSLVPARVVVINQSGLPLSNVVFTTDNGRLEIGSLGRSETRSVSVSPTANLRMSFEGRAPRIWSSPSGLSAGQALVLSVTPDEKVIARDRIVAIGR